MITAFGLRWTGVTLKNVKEVHIIDVFFNIPKAEQVIGRAIRMCVHEDVINDDLVTERVFFSTSGFEIPTCNEANIINAAKKILKQININILLYSK